ncbi:MAG: hypothetical protein ABSD89_03890 [Halobacteriota archaeon]
MKIDILTLAQGQKRLLAKYGSKLSALSIDVLNSTYQKDVTIVLSQGSFNLTPIISSVHAGNFHVDVLVGLPSNNFSKLYDKYAQTFFSLLSPSVGGFFYKKVRWAQGELDEATDELSDLSIKTYPKFGIPAYKKAYDSHIKEELKKRLRRPQVACVPIKRAIPAGVKGQKKVTYKDGAYPASYYNPTLIILESINERPFSLDGISQLIRNTLSRKTKLVLHFSWPYLRGLEEFLSQDLIQDCRIGVFHLGKRLCFELRKQMRKPPSFAIAQSLEGSLWDSVYYPDENKRLAFKILISPSANLPGRPDEAAIASCAGPCDEWVTNIRERIYTEHITNPIAESILLFPPVIDSFLSPSELKIRSLLHEGPRYISLQDYVSDNTPPGSSVFGLYKGLCSELQTHRDLSYQMQGLHTSFAVTKKTLLQSYVLKNVQAAIEGLKRHSEEQTPQYIKINLKILNLHPLLGSRSALIDSLYYLFESISRIRAKIVLPEISKQAQRYGMNILGRDRQFGLEETHDQPFRLGDLERSIAASKVPLTASHAENAAGESRIIVSLDTSNEYFEFEQSEGKKQVKKTYAEPLVLYSKRLENGEDSEELSVLNVELKRDQYLNRLRVVFNFLLKTPRSLHTPKIELEMSYIELEQIKRFSREEIISSQLLIPGAIPFHTITDDKLMICEHFDSLLLPFKQVVFFAYPGNNFKRLARQIQSYNDLFSKERTRTANIDLTFSVQHSNGLKRLEMPEAATATEELEYVIGGDTAIDAAMRQDLMLRTTTDDDETSDPVTLKQIWDKIRRVPRESEGEWNYDGASISSKIDRNQVHLSVQYDNGVVEAISFSEGTLLRKKIGAGFEIFPVEDARPGDNILYIQAAERESVDNFLLRDYLLQRDIQLERILEPITCLKLFYEALKSIRVNDGPANEKLETIYWLNDLQRSVLFRTVQFLLQSHHRARNFDGVSMRSEAVDLQQDYFWADFIGLPDLISIFNKGNVKLTYRKLYAISTSAGTKLSEGYFKGLCSAAIHEQDHYFFRDENELLALGKLIRHDDLIEDYHVLNELGRNIGTTLQVIGRCVSRVSSGRSDPFNEMDCSIENKLRRGTVRSVSFVDL